MKKGIDISYYQRNVDFNTVKKSGINFVILREGYRNAIDAKFLEYAKKASSASLQILAVYHFSYALNVKEAVKEAELCIANMKKAGLANNVRAFFDFEYDTVKKAKEKGVTLTKKECNEHTIAFCEKIKELGYIPGIYTNIDYYKNWYNEDVLNKYDIWLADYSGEPDYHCIIQQYSDKGTVPGIKGNVDIDYFYDEDFKMEDKTMKSRSEVVELARSWIGLKESDGSHKKIIDIYNSYKGKLPRGIKMKYDWSWCACTWSALAIKLGYTDIMPIEISCGELIKKAKEMGCWKENDGYVPLPGDGILYDWDDNGIGDNTGWPEHVGIVEMVVNSKNITVIEGNKNDAVDRRLIKVDGKYIRGFITPKYDDSNEVKENVSSTENNKWIVTAHSLNCREMASNTSRILCTFSNGTELIGTGKTVNNSINTTNGKKWIEVKIPKSTKTGWCSEAYLKKI